MIIGDGWVGRRHCNNSGQESCLSSPIGSMISVTVYLLKMSPFVLGDPSLPLITLFFFPFFPSSRSPHCRSGLGWPWTHSANSSSPSRWPVSSPSSGSSTKSVPGCPRASAPASSASATSRRWNGTQGNVTWTCWKTKEKCVTWLFQEICPHISCFTLLSCTRGLCSALCYCFW